jgi:hypothetical protein
MAIFTFFPFSDRFGGEQITFLCGRRGKRSYQKTNFDNLQITDLPFYPGDLGVRTYFI